MNLEVEVRPQQTNKVAATKTGFVAMNVAILLPAVIFCAAALLASRGDINTTIVFKGKENGLYFAQPVFTPRFILRKVKGSADPAKGVSSQCKVRIDIQVITLEDHQKVTVSTMYLECDDTVFEVNGFVIDPRD